MAALLAFALFILLNAGWEDFLNYLFLGLPQGGIIAMIAMGYSMVYGIILLINFAHGEVFMLSAFLALALIVPFDWLGEGSKWMMLSLPAFAAFWGLCSGVTANVLLEGRVRSAPARYGMAAATALLAGGVLFTLFRMAVPFVPALLVAAIVAPTLGITLDRLAYRPLRRAPRLIPLITAIGVSIFLLNFAQVVFGTADFRIPDERLPQVLQPYFPAWDEPQPEGFWENVKVARTLVFTETLRVPLVDVLILVLAVVMMLGVNGFVQHTKTGAAMRACALDQNMARLVGIDVDRTVALTFAMGSMLAAVAAPFYVVKYVPISAPMGLMVGILAFSSAVLGGIGNIKGAMLGGFLIGVVFNMVPILEVTSHWPFFRFLARLFPALEGKNLLAGISEWRVGVAYLFMIMVILFKPQGLLGQAAAARRA
jgi:branched-chain amino acid transport system permease protein